MRFLNGLGKCTWDQQNQRISRNQRNAEVDVSIHIFQLSSDIKSYHIVLQIPEVEGALEGRPSSRMGYSSGTECSQPQIVCGRLEAGKPGTSCSQSTHTPPSLAADTEYPHHLCLRSTNKHRISLTFRLASTIWAGVSEMQWRTSLTLISSLFQLQGCGAQADPQFGCVEQELCVIFLSGWSLFPGHATQEADFCLSPLLFTLQFPCFRAQQRVLWETKSHFKANNIESHQK